MANWHAKQRSRKSRRKGRMKTKPGKKIGTGATRSARGSDSMLGRMNRNAGGAFCIGAFVVALVTIVISPMGFPVGVAASTLHRGQSNSPGAASSTGNIISQSNKLQIEPKVSTFPRMYSLIV